MLGRGTSLIQALPKPPGDTYCVYMGLGFTSVDQSAQELLASSQEHTKKLTSGTYLLVG